MKCNNLILERAQKVRKVIKWELIKRTVGLEAGEGDPFPVLQLDHGLATRECWQ